MAVKFPGAGHVSTVASHWFDRPHHTAPLRRVCFPVASQHFGQVLLAGELAAAPAHRELVVVLHGLGGDTTSVYMGRALRAAWSQGLDCLLVNLRGADGSGSDLYHAGLYEDLVAIVGCEQLAEYRARYVFGYSIGGNIALLAATQRAFDARAVAAVCPPLDLAATSGHLDRPGYALYRRHIFRGLHSHYRALVRSLEQASSPEAPRPPLELAGALGTRTFNAWDEAIVAPWHGFRDRFDYYDKASSGPRLGRLRVPALVVTADADPMVPRASTDPWLVHQPGLIHWRHRAGGHLAFPSRADFGLPAPLGLEHQAVAWLRSQG